MALQRALDGLPDADEETQVYSQQQPELVLARCSASHGCGESCLAPSSCLVLSLGWTVSLVLHADYLLTLGKAAVELPLFPVNQVVFPPELLWS